MNDPGSDPEAGHLLAQLVGLREQASHAVFEALPRATTDADIEALLPWRIELPESALHITTR